MAEATGNLNSVARGLTCFPVPLICNTKMTEVNFTAHRKTDSGDVTFPHKHRDKVVDAVSDIASRNAAFLP